MQKIAIFDYGSSNLHSVAKALRAVASKQHEILITDQHQTILAADKVVFPGQGAIGQCIQQLKKNKLIEIIKECARNKPFLGICMGLQLLLDTSTEDGGVAGLGIIPGQVVRFKDGIKNLKDEICKVPHMGWNQVQQKSPHPLWQDIANNSHFYFVHSYYVQTENSQDTVAQTYYTTEFTSAIAKDNIFATQFHPEKSQHIGLTLLRNFLSWDGNKP